MKTARSSTVRSSTPAAPGIRLAEGLATELEVGQVVRGAVRSVSPSGEVVLHLRGRTVKAVTDLPLGSGTTYEFTVVERSPRVVLTPTRVLPLPPLSEALAEGWLGPSAAELLRGVSDLASENARRAQIGVPVMLPWSVEEGSWLREARLFLPWQDEVATDGGEAGRAFTLVLLLELSALGPLRIDIGVRGREVSLTFRAERASALDALRAASPAIESALGADGLALRGTVFRQAGPAGLPVSDLVAPPAAREASSTVDVHV